MPSVTVTLKHTPKPDVVYVALGDDPEGMAVHFRDGRVWIEGDDLTMGIASFDPAEALAIARALALVAGCADPRWRGGHWEAREQNERLLATTPLGEWYVNRDDCLKDIRTMFGYGVRVVLLSDDIGHAGLLRSAYDRDIIDTGPHPTADDTTDGYEQLCDVPREVTRVQSRSGFIATKHDDGRWRGDRGQVIPLDAGGWWSPTADDTPEAEQ